MAKNRRTIEMTAPVEILAGEEQQSGPKKFKVVAYTGGIIELGWGMPVIVDLSGMGYGNSLVANLDHERSKRVGHVTEKFKDNGELVLGGVASAATEWRDEVVQSAADGFVWQASIEARVVKYTELKAGQTAQVNGQTVEGPLFIVRKCILKGFAFVSHGADDNTSVQIAAAAAGNQKGRTMDGKLKEWIVAIGLDPEELSAETIEGLAANFDGKPTPPKRPQQLDDIFAQQQADRERKGKITDLTAQFFATNENLSEENCNRIQKLADNAIKAGWDADKFELELLRASQPQAHTVIHSTRTTGVTGKVLEAAICMGANMENVDKAYGDQTCQAAYDHFKNGIGLKQLICMAAEGNGYYHHYGQVTPEVHNAAWGLSGNGQIRAASTMSLPGILSNVANKFLRQGFEAVEDSWKMICEIQPTKDFKQIKTYSLVGPGEFLPVGADGQLKHATVGEVEYTNQAGTSGLIFAITRTDIINDDLGALTSLPRRIGIAGARTLNRLVWPKFMNNGSFFTELRGNLAVGAGTALSLASIEQADNLFASQVDPGGNPLGVEAAILLVPRGLQGTANTLMNSERMITGESKTLGDANVWKDRFKVVSSAYLHNSNFTGHSAKKWYLLADPKIMPVIAIAALNGRVEPVVETATAAFNVLGWEMRGYTDVGVELQEFRAGVAMKGEA